MIIISMFQNIQLIEINIMREVPDDRFLELCMFKCSAKV